MAVAYVPAATGPRWPYPRFVAHRGGGSGAPENTLAALAAARAASLAGVEFDAMLTADGVAVLMHDDRLGRTVAGSGSVAHMSAATLMARDAGQWFHPRFTGERVPSLAQALAALTTLGLWANIEIKPVPGHDVITGEVVARQVALWWASQGAGAASVVSPSMPAGQGVSPLAPLLSSFSVPALQAAQRQAPHLARGLLVERIPRDVLHRLQVLQARALHVRHDHLSPFWVQRLQQAGYGVMAYTVNDPGRARELLAWGVDALCTDCLDLPQRLA